MRFLVLASIGCVLSACAELEFSENKSIADNDGDGYAVSDGDCDDGNASLNPADADDDGVTTCDGDCDDEDRATYPGSAEIDSPEACMRDQDGDGYGDASAPNGGYAGTDCDDQDPRPGDTSAVKAVGLPRGSGSLRPDADSSADLGGGVTG
jgi:hypothetical protein